MSKIDLKLDYGAVVARINKEKQRFKPIEWARMVGVSKNIISNVHGKTGQKPSVEYIIAVARATKKPVEYYLWGSTETEAASPRVVAQAVAGFGHPSERDLLSMTKEVLRSGTGYEVALAANIRAFYRAIESERRLEDHEKRLAVLEKEREAFSIEEPSRTGTT